jgi:Na+/melibiose symporter-like transporter
VACSFLFSFARSNSFNISGAEVGPFRAVEESILAQLTDKQHRSDIYTWYTLFGHGGTAVGTLTCGWTIQILSVYLQWNILSAYRVIFAAYAFIGGIKLVFTLMLSKEVEVESFRAQYDVLPLQEEGTSRDGQVVFEVGDDDEEEQQEDTSHDKQLHSPKIAMTPPDQPTFSTKIRSIMPSISSASTSILFRLLFLLSIDAFASGLASASWMTYFFTTVHKLQPSSLGTLFLVTGLLSTLSNFAALPLTRRIGNLLTMSACHFPSTIFLAAIPFFSTSPSGTWFAMASLALRACTQSMDVAPRQAFISAAVLPAERTAVLGITNVAKTLANALGIGLSGVLAEAGNWKLMFASAGILKATYDLLIVATFYGKGDREDDQR